MKQPIFLLINAVAGFGMAMLVSILMFAGLLGGGLVFTALLSFAAIAGYIFAVKALLKKFSPTGSIKEPTFTYMNYAMPFIMLAFILFAVKMGW